MGHIIAYYDYPATMDKASIFAALDEQIEEGGDWNSESHLSPIRWLKTAPCENRDEAEESIHDNDKGWYDCLAVQYKAPSKKSKAYLDLEQRYQKACARYDRLNKQVYVTTVESAFIGCKNCGSKLSREYLLKERVPSNFCPVCHADLRSATTQERIKNASETKKEIQKKMKQEEARMAKRNKEIYWLIKVEFRV